jgi:hypothetical protein
MNIDSETAAEIKRRTLEYIETLKKYNEKNGKMEVENIKKPDSNDFRQMKKLIRENSPRVKKFNKEGIDSFKAMMKVGIKDCFDFPDLDKVDYVIEPGDIVNNILIYDDFNYCTFDVYTACFPICFNYSIEKPSCEDVDYFKGTCITANPHKMISSMKALIGRGYFVCAAD